MILLADIRFTSFLSLSLPEQIMVRTTDARLFNQNTLTTLTVTVKSAKQSPKKSFDSDRKKTPLLFILSVFVAEKDDHETFDCPSYPIGVDAASSVLFFTNMGRAIF